MTRLQSVTIDFGARATPKPCTPGLSKATKPHFNRLFLTIGLM